MYKVLRLNGILVTIFAGSSLQNIELVICFPQVEGRRDSWKQNKERVFY